MAGEQEAARRADPPGEQRVRRLWWALLLLSHATAVLCSRGYYQADEHFQVLQFIQWKLGNVPTDRMPWELPAQMRPWTHALFFFPLEAFSHYVLEISPFVRTALHRTCMAAFALFVISRLTRGRDKRLLALYALLFFFPFLDTRISSEVFGGWLLALAFALDGPESDGERRNLRVVGIGLLLGLTGVIRLQLWSMVGGLLLFHLLRRDGRRLLLLGTGILAAIGASVPIDTWGYGQFVCVPWNYVHQNLVLDKASTFGVSAPYAYVPMLLDATFYVPGAVMLLALVQQWLSRPLGKLTLMTVSFVVLHVAVGHKELRFLFSLAPFVPIVLLPLWHAVSWVAFARAAAGLFLAMNTVLLVPASVRDAMPEVGMYVAMLSQPLDPDERLYFVARHNVLRPNGLYVDYYLGWPEREATRVTNAARPPKGLFATMTLGDFDRAQRRNHCRLLAVRYPAAMRDALRRFFRHGLSTIPMWALWRCR